MKLFLQILLTLGLVSLVIGAALAVTGTKLVLTPQGYWRGAMAFWMLLVATRMAYQDKT
jgi:cyanate permease